MQMTKAFVEWGAKIISAIKHVELSQKLQDMILGS